MATAIPLVVQVLAAGAVSAAGISGVTAALIIGGSTLLGGYIANELFGNSDDTSQNADKLAIRGNYVSTERTVPLIYGRRLVGSNDVFIELGSKGQTPTDKHPYMWIVHVLGEGLCDSISTIDIDGVPKDEIYIDGKGAWEYPDGFVTYWFYNGDGEQESNPYITEGTRIKSQDKFDDAMRHTAYIIFRLRYTDSEFAGVPSREVVLNGMKVLDQRSEEVAWSENPALILYDYLTNTRYGMGWDPALLSTESFNEAATYCDQEGWSIGYVVASGVKSQTIIDTILGHFRGALFWYNDILSVKFLDLRGWETPVFNVGDEHIARNQAGKAIVTVNQPSRFNIPDGAVINYINARNNWVTDRVSVGETNGQIKALDFVGFTDRAQARSMGMYVLERQRLNRVYTFVLRADTIALDTNDLITFSSSELNMSGQLARVKTNSIGSDGLITVTAVLEADSLYSNVFDEDTSIIYDVDFPSIADEPPSVEDVYVIEDIYFYRGISYIRLNVYFSPPSTYPWFSHVDVYVGFPDKVTGLPPEESDYLSRFPATSAFQIDPVEEGQYYYIRLNSVSLYNVKQRNEDAFRVVHKVRGVSSNRPPCPEYISASVNLSAVDIVSNKLDAPDVAGYEIRLGSSWRDSIFLTFRSHPSVSFSGVKSGTHQFWLNTQHTNGYYCLNPVSATVTIEEPPPGSHLFFEEVVNYATGSASNTTDSGTYPNQSLSCTHTDQNLTGVYVTTEFDTANEATDLKMLVYVSFDFSIVGGGSKWTDVAPVPSTWYDFAFDDIEGLWKTWDVALGSEGRLAAPKLDISIGSSSVAGGPYVFVDRMELLSAIVTGRYVIIRYTITDYNLSTNLTIGASTLKAAYLEDNLLIGA